MAVSESSPVVRRRTNSARGRALAAAGRAGAGPRPVGGAAPRSPTVVAGPARPGQATRPGPVTSLSGAWPGATVDQARATAWTTITAPLRSATKSATPATRRNPATRPAKSGSTRRGRLGRAGVAVQSGRRVLHVDGPADQALGHGEAGRLCIFAGGRPCGPHRPGRPRRPCARVRGRRRRRRSRCSWRRSLPRLRSRWLVGDRLHLGGRQSLPARSASSGAPRGGDADHRPVPVSTTCPTRSSPGPVHPAPHGAAARA